ncbi:unnamed protein product [Dibothriocephalus latus]|uniref:Uncharacterized protein n=1 Tax=Dibothriocephalus latus TaxID=60516 RepID=A0A3P7LNY3_DIBLA|nr:unnamed protein product [Dibothriocephalus latus]
MPPVVVAYLFAVDLLRSPSLLCYVSIFFTILKLANKCLSSASRDLIHAYDLMKQVCRNLHDAHTDYVRFLPQPLSTQCSVYRHYYCCS